MSWSFQIAHGDLALSSHGLGTVSGAAKLIQDLRCALLERTGTDALHPGYGSQLDGGIDEFGNPVPSLIGDVNDTGTATLASAEVQRVCAAYQGQQVARNANDVATYGKSTLTADEALLNFEGITIQQVADQMLLNVKIQTGMGSLPLSLPFSVSS